MEGEDAKNYLFFVGINRFKEYFLHLFSLKTPIVYKYLICQYFENMLLFFIIIIYRN
jgi:hypothetical protein